MSWISLLTNIYPQTYCVREKEEIKSDGISFTVNFNIFLFLILLPPFFFQALILVLLAMTLSFPNFPSRRCNWYFTQHSWSALLSKFQHGSLIFPWIKYIIFFQFYWNKYPLKPGFKSLNFSSDCSYKFLQIWNMILWEAGIHFTLPFLEVLNAL